MGRPGDAHAGNNARRVIDEARLREGRLGTALSTYEQSGGRGRMRGSDLDVAPGDSHGRQVTVGAGVQFQTRETFKASMNKCSSLRFLKKKAVGPCQDKLVSTTTHQCCWSLRNERELYQETGSLKGWNEDLGFPMC